MDRHQTELDFAGIHLCINVLSAANQFKGWMTSPSCRNCCAGRGGACGSLSWNNSSTAPILPFVVIHTKLRAATELLVVIPLVTSEAAQEVITPSLTQVSCQCSIMLWLIVKEAKQSKSQIISAPRWTERFTETIVEETVAVTARGMVVEVAVKLVPLAN